MLATHLIAASLAAAEPAMTPPLDKQPVPAAALVAPPITSGPPPVIAIPPPENPSNTSSAPLPAEAQQAPSVPQ
jgi:hypothetical protein